LSRLFTSRAKRSEQRKPMRARPPAWSCIVTPFTLPPESISRAVIGESARYLTCVPYNPKERRRLPNGRRQFFSGRGTHWKQFHEKIF
jgi:hypothetical protein